MSSPPAGSLQLPELVDEDGASTIRQPSFDFSDHDASDNDEEHPGDYSTRMEELFDEEDESDAHVEDEEDEEEGFLYTGVDAGDIPTGYRDQLRDVLGSDLTDDDEMEANEVEKSLVIDEHDEVLHFEDDTHSHPDVHSDNTPSTSSIGLFTPQRIGSPALNGSALKMARPFLHPTVSRLRSYPSQAHQPVSNGSGMTSHSHLNDGMSPSPSHFSAMSHMSSVTNLHADSSSDHKNTGFSRSADAVREVFRWTDLRHVTEHMYNSLTQKLSSVLGAPLLGTPTVLAANGLICIGTDEGKICVYDFRQTLKCICGADTSAKTVGAVTALALSHDHTYVASGHATGYIQLYDLKHPQTPARSVPPTTLAAVASGRKEGHLQGSRIVSIGFIAGRHTAIVSSDDHGLAFSHSLGKVLFVEAPDILRILGKYHQEDIPPTPVSTQTSTSDIAPPPRRKSKYTILGTVPLPLGTSPHATDQYNVIAMLTPTKLVVVGLKPTPRTWFKCPRDVDEGGSWRSKSKWRGTMAWYPSVLPPSASKLDSEQRKPPAIPQSDVLPTTPILLYTWGSSLHLIRVMESRTKQRVQNPRTGKMSDVEVGRIVYEDAGRWSAEDDILAVQWLNANQVIVLTAAVLQVYDVHASKVVEHVSFDGLSLVSPTLASTVNGAISYSDSVGDVSHSLRVYKGKIFLLARDGLRVGTLLTWADRILSLVQDGDFLSAIDLSRSYYVGDAPGNRNGLPDDPNLRKEVVGEKMQALMVASVQYAFSEERMTDNTHVTSDGRGVDRTSLFEGLVTVSCRACVALEDTEFIFEDLFQHYDDAGISKIYLRQLEPFILDNEIRYVPPRITQRLVALHEEDGRPDLVERIIWHIDPACLDINQAIHLCQRYHLYDALIYVYTRALHDCVAPVVELLGLIRKVQQYRRSRLESTEADESEADMDAAMEPIFLNAYKIYPYLSNILSGLSYPSGEPLSEDEATQAKKDVYSFLFFGRSSVWPPGEGAKLVLTSDEDGGIEPTYPYARQLLRFDSESFLHSLDIAFEDPYLNDETQGTSRLLIVRILLEILSSGDLPPSDVTFINIFIARNVPKYPQFLQVAPSALHGILIGLAEDPDPDTREDRQLAAEYLLSVYNPHESEHIIHLFEAAGFYRILRTWYRHEQRWAPLLSTYLDDSDLRPSDVFHNIDNVLTISRRTNKGNLSPDLIDVISHALPRLLETSLTSTAVLLDAHAPDLHERALQSLGDDGDPQRFLYLRHLLGPPQQEEEEEDHMPSIRTGPSLKVPTHLRQLYVSLQCRYRPKDVVVALKYLPAELLDWEDVLHSCESNEVFHAVVWATNWRGDPRQALLKAETFEKRLTLKLVEDLFSDVDLTPQQIASIHHNVESLEDIGRTGIAVCLEHSQGASKADVPLEDIWFQLLSSQINCIQALSGSLSKDIDNMKWNAETRATQGSTLSKLRALVQATFASLVSVTSTHAVSFPRLFKRLVTSAPASTSTQYTEFRIILTGMLESYRSDGDMLVITKHLVDRDLFETMAEIARERDRGWGPSQLTCLYCRKPLLSKYHSQTSDVTVAEIVVSRTGKIYHNRCLPPEP
ncbi:Vacuolar protein sorting-associated protein 8 [Hypsizygus marmoreus]|uniref:Vacuolar protein sorting-associated protein 8 n=1 Tax=Hypsizygus marmoreus TaxID=39966 RepID=A0A369JVH6_HYPMA|nr:Vacuolar protein sorting-associated protein 8 [Hypsizygus marmoreus]